jgi:hypothetical protein
MPIEAGGSCTVLVGSRSTRIGFQQDDVLTISASPGGTVRVELRSYRPDGPPLSINPSSHDFGSILVGMSSAPFGFTVTNYGGCTLELAMLFTANSQDFAVPQMDGTTCPRTLSPGESCAVRVTFAPKTPGAKSSVLNAVYVGAVTASASITGTGVAP